MNAINRHSRDEVKVPGDFAIHHDAAGRPWITLHLPNDTIPCLLPLHFNEVAYWQLSGSADRPTLHPSIDAVGIWHGWLKDGQLLSC